MSRKEQTIIFEDGFCGIPSDIDNKDPSLKGFAKPLDLVAKYDELGEQASDPFTCDSDVAMPDVEQFEELAPCEICKNVCIDSIDLEGGEKYCNDRDQQVIITGTLSKEYKGSVECYIQLTLMGTELDDSSGGNPLYTYAKVLPGASAISERKVILPNGTWKVCSKCKS